MIDDIGLYLARFVCGSTLLFATVWMVERANLVKHLQLRAWLWKLAILGSLILLIPFSTSISQPYRLPIALPVSGQPVGDAILTSPYKPSYKESIQQVDATAQNNMGARNDEINTGFNETGSINTREKTPVQTPKPERKISTVIFPLFSQPIVLAGFLWALLSGLALGRLLVGYLHGIRSLGQRLPVDQHSHVYHLYADLCHKAGFNPPPALSTASHLATPVTLLNNEICLPLWVDENLHEGEIRSLLAHELAHVKNNDLHWLLGTQILSCLFFFQPFFLLARNRLVDISEFLADQSAVAQCGNSSDIANALLTCATEIRHQHIVGSQHTIQWGLAMAGQPSRLRLRIETLMHSSGNVIAGLSRWKKISAIASVLAFVVLVPKLEYSYALTAEEQETETLAEWEQQGREIAEELKEVAAQREALRQQQHIEEREQAQITAQLEKRQAMLAKQQEQLKSIKHLQEEMAREQEGLITGDNTSSSVNIRSNGRSHAKWTTNGQTEEIYWRGHIGVNDEENLITSFEGNGFFKYSSSGFNPNRSIEIRNRGNDIVIDYQVDGRATEFADADRQWLHEVLVRFFRHTGVDAEARVERLLRQGGVDTVVGELPHINSDSAHRVYTTTLVKKATLSDQQFDLTMEAAGTVSSDSEMRRLMLAVIEHGNVTGKRWDYLLPVTMSIASDSEMRHLLEAIAERGMPFNSEQWHYFLTAAHTIASDSEARRLLTTVINHGDVLTNNHKEFFQVANTISSDSELGRLLSEPKLLPQLGDANWDDYFQTAATISSDSEMSSLLVDLMASVTLNEHAWKLIFSLLSESVSSDSEKERVLKQAASSLPDNNEELRTLYNNTVFSIGSRSARENLSLL